MHGQMGEKLSGGESRLKAGCGQTTRNDGSPHGT